MTDVGDYADHRVQHHDLKQDVPSTSNPGRSVTFNANKRKRDSLHANAPGRRMSGDGPRVSQFKRAALNNTSANHISTADNQADTSFLTQPTSATSDDEINQSSSTTLDFHSLGDQDPRLQHNGSTGASSATATAEAALSQHFQMTVPQPTDISFQSATSADDGDRSYMQHGASGSHHGLGGFKVDAIRDGSQNGADGSPSTPGSGQKPAVGSQEWHKIRKDNHKEVERRRREMINEGINELAKIVPGCEKNKGAVLQRAVSYITQLKENEAANIEKWTLEKLLTEQAINELGLRLDNTRTELRKWKKAAEQAGIVPEEYKESEETAEGEGESSGNGGES